MSCYPQEACSRARRSAHLRNVICISLTALTAGFCFTVEPAAAQQEEVNKGLEEVVVTARKRDETSIAVPVVLTAVGKVELERKGIVGMDGLARIVPGLVIGEGGATAAGGEVVMRGIGGADTNLLGDHAVSFNIDGVAIARASVRRMAQMDIQQIEVLKGPQTLFFGKNSPAGIITVRTADPTPTFEAKLSAGYEFKAREKRVEGYLSGPITQTLGVRFAFYGSKMAGWVDNTTPRTSPFAPERQRQGRTEEAAGRMTLKYDPGEKFNARLKVAYGYVGGDSSASSFQLIDCPRGFPQNGSADNCVPDNVTTMGDPGPSFPAKDARFSPHNFMKQSQFLTGLEMNYSPTPVITVTSVTGYYDTNFEGQGNFTVGYNAPTLLPSRFHIRIKEISQELRAATNFERPLNFTAGAYVQNADGDASTITLFNANTPTFINAYFYHQKTQAYSMFGQVRWNILPKLEFAAGGRYSHERKKLPLHNNGLLETFAPVPIDNVSFNNFSPEATLSYRPSNNLTLFSSYKQGFLSGGFNTGAPAPALGAAAPINSIKYNQETVKGFEGGIKSLLLNGNLRTNLAFYAYKIEGLQLTVTVAGTTVELRNAGNAASRGAEFDFTYRTPIDGLSVNGAGAYTHARYKQYIASCYFGLPAPACANRLNPSSGLVALSQDLAGQQVIRAPDWTGTIGFDFERPLGDKLKIGLNSSVSYTSSYFTDAGNKPAGRQPGYELVDAAVRFGDQNDRWELAFIGRNLTNQYYWVRSATLPFSGSPAGGPAATNIPSDTVASISRGRELMVRLSHKFGG